jgi:hypothetical protein
MLPAAGLRPDGREEMGMAELSGSPYEQAHLVVAAVRLFSHREGKMPTAADIAALTGFPLDAATFLCNRLVELEVLKVVKGAFDDRFHVGNHLKLEELPRSVDSEEMVKEVERFRSDRMEKQKKIQEMFMGKEHDRRKQERLKELEKDFGGPGKKRPNPLDSLTKKPHEPEEE